MAFLDRERDSSGDYTDPAIVGGTHVSEGISAMVTWALKWVELKRAESEAARKRERRGGSGLRLKRRR